MEKVNKKLLMKTLHHFNVSNNSRLWYSLFEKYAAFQRSSTAGIIEHVLCHLLSVIDLKILMLRNIFQQTYTTNRKAIPDIG